jgi:hypothetical protein
MVSPAAITGTLRAPRAASNSGASGGAGSGENASRRRAPAVRTKWATTGARAPALLAPLLNIWMP